MMDAKHIFPLANVRWIFFAVLPGILMLSGCVVAPAGEVVAPEPAEVVVAPEPVFVGPPVIIGGHYYRR